MARIARVVAPGLPHHVTQRGNRRQAVFFSEADYEAYLACLSEGCASAGTEVWAYCLMPNHVHLLLAPFDKDGLRAALGEAHRRYTRGINFREGWRGHLWQERFASFPVSSGPYLRRVVQYIELNPVRARLAARPEDWLWSSVRAHMSGQPDPLLRLGGESLLKTIPDWRTFLSEGLDEDSHRLVRRHESTGRPLGSEEFVSGIEAALGRILSPQKRGPKMKENAI